MGVPPAVRGESGASSSVATTSLDSRLQELLGLGLLVLPFALWGTAMVSTKLVLPDTSPLFVAVARLLPAGIILCGVAASRKAPLPRGAAAWLGVVLFGLVDGTLFHFLMAQGLQNTTAGLGSVIIDSQPLTVAVLAALFLGEPITTVAATGLAIGLLGLVVGLLPPTFFEASGGMGLGALLSAAGPAAWGSGESMLLVAAQSMAVGTVLARWVCKDLVRLRPSPLTPFPPSCSPRIFRLSFPFPRLIASDFSTTERSTFAQLLPIPASRVWSQQWPLGST